MTKNRFTFRPSSFVFQSASKAAEKKGISMNSELNQILTTYYEFMSRNPNASVWALIQKDNKK